MKIAILITAVLMMVCCEHREVQDDLQNVPAWAPVYDRYIGKSEKQILEVNGRPLGRSRLHKHRLRDEMRQRIYSRLQADFVEELKFNAPNGVLYIWLEKTDGKSRVIGDVSVPKGTFF